MGSLEIKITEVSLDCFAWLVLSNVYMKIPFNYTRELGLPDFKTFSSENSASLHAILGQSFNLDSTKLKELSMLLLRQLIYFGFYMSNLLESRIRSFYETKQLINSNFFKIIALNPEKMMQNLKLKSKVRRFHFFHPSIKTLQKTKCIKNLLFLKSLKKIQMLRPEKKINNMGLDFGDLVTKNTTSLEADTSNVFQEIADAFEFEISYKFRVKLMLIESFSVCRVSELFSNRMNISVLSNISREKFLKIKSNTQFYLRRFYIDKLTLFCSYCEGLEGGGCGNSKLKGNKSNISNNRSSINSENISTEAIKNPYNSNSVLEEFERTPKHPETSTLKKTMMLSKDAKLKNLKVYNDSKNEEIMRYSKDLAGSLLSCSVKKDVMEYLANLKPAKIKNPFEVGMEIIKSIYEERLWNNPKFFDIRRTAISLARKFISIGILKEPEFIDDKTELRNYIKMLTDIYEENEEITPDHILLLSLISIKEMIETPYKVFSLWHFTDSNEGILELVESLFYLKKFDLQNQSLTKILDPKYNIFEEYGRKISTYFLLYDSIETLSKSFNKQNFVDVSLFIAEHELKRKKFSSGSDYDSNFDADLNVIALDFLYIVLQLDQISEANRVKIIKEIKKLDLKNQQIAEKCLLICRKIISNKNLELHEESQLLKDTISNYYSQKSNKRIRSLLKFKLIRLQIGKQFNKFNSNSIKQPKSKGTVRLPDLMFFRENLIYDIRQIFNLERSNYVILEGLFRMGKKRLAFYYANEFQHLYKFIYLKTIKSKRKLTNFFDEVSNEAKDKSEILIILISLKNPLKIIKFVQNFTKLHVIIVAQEIKKSNHSQENSIKVSGLDFNSSSQLFELHLGSKMKAKCEGVSKDLYNKIIKHLQGWPLAYEIVASDIHENYRELESRLNMYIECFGENEEIKLALMKFLFKDKLEKINHKLLDIIWFCKPPKIPAFICKKILNDNEYRQQTEILENYYIIERDFSFITIHPFIHENLPDKNREKIKLEIIRVIKSKLENLRRDFEKTKLLIKHAIYFLSRKQKFQSNNKIYTENEIDIEDYIIISIKIIYFFLLQNNDKKFKKKIEYLTTGYLNKINLASVTKSLKIDYLVKLIRVFYDHYFYDTANQLLYYTYEIDKEINYFRFFLSAKILLIRISLSEINGDFIYTINKKDEQIIDCNNYFKSFVALKDFSSNPPLYALADSLFILAFEFRDKKYLKSALEYLEKCNYQNLEDYGYLIFKDCLIDNCFCLFCGTVCNESNNYCKDCEREFQKLISFKYSILTLYSEDCRTFDYDFEINSISLKDLIREDLTEDIKAKLIKSSHYIQMFLDDCNRDIDLAFNKKSCKFMHNNKYFYLIRVSPETYERALGIISSYTKDEVRGNQNEAYPRSISYFSSFLKTKMLNLVSHKMQNPIFHNFLEYLLQPTTGFVFNDRIYFKEYFILYLWSESLFRFSNKVEEQINKFGIFLFMYLDDIKNNMYKFKGIDPILYVKTLRRIIEALILIKDNEKYLKFDQMLYCFLKVYKSYHSHMQNQNYVSKKSIISHKFNSSPDLTQELIDASLRIIHFFEHTQNLQFNETSVEYYTCIIAENLHLNFLSPDDFFKYNYILSLFYQMKITDENIVYLENALNSFNHVTELKILQDLTKFSLIVSDYFFADNNQRISIKYLEIARNIDYMILSSQRSENFTFYKNLSEKHEKISEFYMLKNISQGKKELIRLVSLLLNKEEAFFIEKLKQTYHKLIEVSPSHSFKKKIYLKLVNLENNHENLAFYFEELGKYEKIIKEKVSFYNKSIYQIEKL